VNDKLDPTSTSILGAANSLVLWIAVVGVFTVIIIQSVIYFRAVKRAAPAVGMSDSDVTTAFRAGAVASIGPSLAVCLIAITLVSVFGTPGVLTRIGLIGSAAFDVAAAGIASNASGATLGGAGYTQAVFANVLLCIAVAGGGWMIVTLIVTPLFKRGTGKIASSGTSKGAAVMAIIPMAALMGAFCAMAVQQAAKGAAASLVIATGAAASALFLWIAKRFHQHWLREWALGFSLAIALFVGVVARLNGLA